MREDEKEIKANFFTFKIKITFTINIGACFNWYTSNHCQPSCSLKSKNLYYNPSEKSRERYKIQVMALGSLYCIKNAYNIESV